MPSHQQITVEIVPTTYGSGESDTARLQSMFPASPIYAGDLTYTTVEEMGNNMIAGELVNDGGHTFGLHNRDYDDAPNHDDVATGGGGLPGSSFSPAPGSPGPGSMNPSDIPTPPADWPPDPGTEYGVGNCLANPSDTSEPISQQVIGEYSLGSSS